MNEELTRGPAEIAILAPHWVGRSRKETNLPIQPHEFPALLSAQRHALRHNGGVPLRGFVYTREEDPATTTVTPRRAPQVRPVLPTEDPPRAAPGKTSSRPRGPRTGWRSGVGSGPWVPSCSSPTTTPTRNGSPGRLTEHACPAAVPRGGAPERPFTGEPDGPRAALSSGSDPWAPRKGASSRAPAGCHDTSGEGFIPRVTSNPRSERSGNPLRLMPRPVRGAVFLF